MKGSARGTFSFSISQEVSACLADDPAQLINAGAAKTDSANQIIILFILEHKRHSDMVGIPVGNHILVTKVLVVLQGIRQSCVIACTDHDCFLNGDS